MIKNISEESKSIRIKEVARVLKCSREIAAAELIAEEWDVENAIMYSGLAA